MTRGTEDQITETNDQVATENFIQQVETGENPEPIATEVVVEEERSSRE